MDALASRFEEHRPHLHAVAWRMLGSPVEADDAVQETWLRLSRVDPATVDNLGGWLTTVVSRICLDMLRSRSTRREDALASVEDSPSDASPESDALVSEAVGVALQAVLDSLAPAERVAFVLHDLFGVSFDEVAALLDRSPAAARQLASRARRRVRGSSPTTTPGRGVVSAFLAASRAGDFDALLALLDPEVVVRADSTVVSFGSAPVAVGPTAVAQTFSGRARAAGLTLVDGLPGAAWLVGGEPRVVFDFTVIDDRIVAIDLLADPEVLRVLELTPA